MNLKLAVAHRESSDIIPYIPMKLYYVNKVKELFSKIEAW